MSFSPCRGSLVLITSESAGESDYGENDVVVGIRTRLQVISDVQDKLVVCFSFDDVAKTFPIHVHPLETEKNMLTKASLLSPENRKSEVPLLSLTPVSLPVGPNSFKILLSCLFIQFQR